MLHLVQRCRPPTPPAHEKVRTNKVLQLHSASPPFPLNDSGKQRESREKWRRRTTRGQSCQSSEVGARPGARAQAQTQSHPAARTWPCRPGGAREEWLPWPGVKIMRENRKMDGYRRPPTWGEGSKALKGGEYRHQPLDGRAAAAISRWRMNKEQSGRGAAYFRIDGRRWGEEGNRPWPVFRMLSLNDGSHLSSSSGSAFSPLFEFR